ncbi:MAG: hypothetical protein HLUCCA08_14215 [Rhodobacteraceae bacterium HLUCCA08]|nr:MAG: hypothetical protein HLUCCA08_14215 [Rhodobacteraceae bacterium HLUCCA08]
MGVIRLTGHMDVPEDRVATVAAALPEHLRLTRAEPGCLRFDIGRDPACPIRFEVDEAFRDRAAFDAHQTRAAGSDWARITAGCTRVYSITEDG